MKIISRVSSWIITLLIPLALSFLGFRLVLTHAFLELEYHIPGFPPDSIWFHHPGSPALVKNLLGLPAQQFQHFLPGRIDISGWFRTVQPARTEPHAGCQAGGPAGSMDRLRGLFFGNRIRNVGAFQRVVEGVFAWCSARRLADSRDGGDHRHPVSHQLLAVLHDLPQAVF